MSEPRSPQAIWHESSQIVIQYSLLECDQCAIALDPSLKWAIEARDEVLKHIKR